MNSSRDMCSSIYGSSFHGLRQVHPEGNIRKNFGYTGHQLDGRVTSCYHVNDFFQNQVFNKNEPSSREEIMQPWPAQNSLP